MQDRVVPNAEVVEKKTGSHVQTYTLPYMARALGNRKSIDTFAASPIVSNCRAIAFVVTAPPQMGAGSGEVQKGYRRPDRAQGPANRLRTRQGWASLQTGLETARLRRVPHRFSTAVRWTVSRSLIRVGRSMSLRRAGIVVAAPAKPAQRFQARR